MAIGGGSRPGSRAASSQDMDEAQRRVLAADTLRELRRILTAAPLRSVVYGTDMTLAQADVLDILIGRTHVRIGELASALRVDASTMTRTVDGLVKGGLARRFDAADDGRGVLVAVTPEGRRRYHLIVSRRIEVMGEILDDFTPDEVEQLIEWMQRVIDALDHVGMEHKMGRAPGNDRLAPGR